MKILVIQTAFIGDVILTLPLVQAIKEYFKNSEIHFVVIPVAKNLLDNHPAISKIIVFDKKRNDSGLTGLLRITKSLREHEYDIALVPHRSLRSALLAKISNIPKRIGFSTSSGKFLFTNVVLPENLSHEIDRNLSLLTPLGYKKRERILPSLYPSASDKKKVAEFLSPIQNKIIAIAPGSVWNTKKWLKENFIELVVQFTKAGFSVVLIGGKEDEHLCEEIKAKIHSHLVLNSAGKFSLLQSAALLQRCTLLVCNDSAPLHIAVAMRTPVVAIFGATVPQFGFYPYGEKDIVIEVENLACRPCGIHGGDKCPIETFECMKNISTEMVFRKVKEKLLQ